MQEHNRLQEFIQSTQYPFVVVSTLEKKDRESVYKFLQEYGAPVYLEGVSGLREDCRLEKLRITCIDQLWELSKASGYPIDGVLRIGGVPTFRPWRDLEEMQGIVEVLSVSHLPFSGLSWGDVVHTQLTDYFACNLPEGVFRDFSEWKTCDLESREKMLMTFSKETRSEPSLMHHLSEVIPENAMVYLGNSLPIREWDQAATYRAKGLEVFASRGLNGIDGQLSTFLGLCQPQKENWGVFGDLTTLYDMAGPWILKQLREVNVNLVVMNNGGGMIFSRMYKEEEFLNQHQLSFTSFANFWGMEYEKWQEVPKRGDGAHHQKRLIEITPDTTATSQFWKNNR